MARRKGSLWVPVTTWVAAFVAVLEFFSARRKIKKSVSVLFAAHVESLSTAARIVSLERYWAMSG